MDALRNVRSSKSAVLANALNNQVGFPKKLIACVFEHMGIRLTRVAVSKSWQPNAMAVMGATNSGVRAIRSNLTTFADILSKINEVYDDRTATLKEDRMKESHFVFQLEVTSAFWGIRDGAGDYVYTADEVASVILHELGHFDHWIRVGLRGYRRIIDAGDIIDYVKQSPDPETIAALLEKLNKSPYIGNSWQPILKAVNQYFAGNPNQVEERYLEAISSMCILVEAEFSTRMLRIIGTALPLKLDRRESLSIEVDAERSADEFAARNGAYEAHVKAFTKMYNEDNGAAYRTLRQFLWSGPALSLLYLNRFFSAFHIGAEDVAFGYDPLFRRLGLTIQAAKHAFSDADLSDSAKQDIHQQIVSAEEYLKAVASTPRRKIRLQIKSWVEAVGKMGRIVGSPIHSRQMGDYWRLQNATRDLSRNPLHYIAQRHTL